MTEKFPRDLLSGMQGALSKIKNIVKTDAWFFVESTLKSKTSKILGNCVKVAPYIDVTVSGATNIAKDAMKYKDIEKGVIGGSLETVAHIDAINGTLIGASTGGVVGAGIGFLIGGGIWFSQKIYPNWEDSWKTGINKVIDKKREMEKKAGKALQKGFNHLTNELKKDINKTGKELQKQYKKSAKNSIKSLDKMINPPRIAKG